MEQTQARYTFLYTGSTGKKEAGEVLPQLNHIMSFPTSIFIDKSGNIRKIHTGFLGPGTGDYYIKYMEKTVLFLKKLLEE